ncbi:MAG: hypothetical protein ACI8UO_006401 [Verrucomicrobiales bacterium]|jgi:hypothetical protein
MIESRSLIFTLIPVFWLSLPVLGCGPQFTEAVLGRPDAILRAPRPTPELELAAIELDIELPGGLKLPEGIADGHPDHLNYRSNIYPAIALLFELSGAELLGDADDCRQQLLESHSDLARDVLEVAGIFNEQVKTGEMTQADAEANIVDYRDFRAVMRGQAAPPSPGWGYRDLRTGARVEFPEFWISQLDRTRIEARYRVRDWPKGLPAEFHDYLEGAIAHHERRFDDARAAFQKLLARPIEDRRYRSTWAAYMLGRLRLAEGDPEFESIAWFRRILVEREAGCADSLGLGWDVLQMEADWRVDQNLEFGIAARFYLALARVGHVDSLRRLRGIMTVDRFEEAASDPILRRIVTAFALRERESPEYWEVEPSPFQNKWLTTLEKAEIQTNEAPSIALIAYSGGQFDLARRWMKRAPDADDELALWLRAKFALQDGKVQTAHRLMKQARPNFPKSLVHVREFNIGNQLDFSASEKAEYRASQFWSDLATIRLGTNDFVGALDAFLHSGQWRDAAWIAEQLLAREELLTYVRDHWPEPIPSGIEGENLRDIRERIRYLTARRLAREHYFKDARQFFPPDLIPAFDRYVENYRRFANSTLTKTERAESGWEVAQLHRKLGMPLFGTEVAPDWTCFMGNYDRTPPEFARLKQVPGDRIDPTPSRSRNPLNDDKNREARLPWRYRETGMPPHQIPPTPDEAWRQRRYAKLPNVYRFHYRHVAADLAWEAAALMPNKSEETAQILCIAGRWIAGRDPKPADRFYKEMIWRNWSTPLARKADDKRWFPAVDWSYDPWAAAGAPEPEWLSRWGYY